MFALSMYLPPNKANYCNFEIIQALNETKHYKTMDKINKTRNVITIRQLGLEAIYNKLNCKQTCPP